MTPEDLARARAEAAADLAELEGHEDLDALIAATPDPATDGLECDHGASLAEELKDFTDG